MTKGMHSNVLVMIDVQMERHSKFKPFLELFTSHSFKNRRGKQEERIEVA